MAGKSFTRLTFRKTPKTSTQTKSKTAISRETPETQAPPTTIHDYRPDICTFPHYCTHNPAPVHTRFLSTAKTQHTNWKNIQAHTTRPRIQQNGKIETKALPANPTTNHSHVYPNQKARTGTPLPRPEWVLQAETRVPATQSERINVVNRVQAGSNWHQTETKRGTSSCSGWSVFEKIVHRYLDVPLLDSSSSTRDESEVYDFHVEKREVVWEGRGCEGRLRVWEVKTRWGMEVCQEVVYDEFEVEEEDEQEGNLNQNWIGQIRMEELSLNGGKEEMEREVEEDDRIMPGAWRTSEKDEVWNGREEKMAGRLDRTVPVNTKRVRFA